MELDFDCPGNVGPIIDGTLPFRRSNYRYNLFGAVFFYGIIRIEYNHIICIGRRGFAYRLPFSGIYTSHSPINPQARPTQSTVFNKEALCRMHFFGDRKTG